jgi:hypothetical protein
VLSVLGEVEVCPLVEKQKKPVGPRTTEKKLGILRRLPRVCKKLKKLILFIETFVLAFSTCDED